MKVPEWHFCDCGVSWEGPATKCWNCKASVPQSNRLGPRIHDTSRSPAESHSDPIQPVGDGPDFDTFVSG